MEAKDKAIKLFTKFSIEVNDTYLGRLCALICVYEILKTCDFKQRNYWQQVRKEIEKLNN